MNEYHNGVDEVNWEEIYELLDKFASADLEPQTYEEVASEFLDNWHVDSLITRIQKLAREKSDLRKELEEVQQECYDLAQKLKKEQENKKYIDWLKQGAPHTLPYSPPVQPVDGWKYKPNPLFPYDVWCRQGQADGMNGNFQTWL